MISIFAFLLMHSMVEEGVIRYRWMMGKWEGSVRKRGRRGGPRPRREAGRREAEEGGRGSAEGRRGRRVKEGWRREVWM